MLNIDMLKIDIMSTGQELRDELEVNIKKLSRNIREVYMQRMKKNFRNISYLEDKETVDELFDLVTGQYLAYKNGIGVTKKNKQFVDSFLKFYEQTNEYLKLSHLAYSYLYEETVKGNLKSNKTNDSVHSGSLKSVMKNFYAEHEGAEEKLTTVLKSFKTLNNTGFTARYVYDINDLPLITAYFESKNIKYKRTYITDDIELRLKADDLTTKTAVTMNLLLTILNYQEKYISMYDEHQKKYKEIVEFMNDTNIYVDNAIFNRMPISEERMEIVYEAYLEISTYYKKIQNRLEELRE